MTQRVLTGLLVLLASAATTPALAGPCERMSGARWLFYLERNWNGARHMATGVIDFRTNAQLGPVLIARGPTQPPTGHIPGPLQPGRQHGEGEIRGATCVNQTDPIAIISMSSAEPITVSVSADGNSAVIQPDQGVFVGWAERLPTPPMSPPRVR